MGLCVIPVVFVVFPYFRYGHSSASLSDAVGFAPQQTEFTAGISGNGNGEVITSDKFLTSLLD